MLEKQEKRYRRHKRVRAKISGNSNIPRLCVFRSNKRIYAQLIDDEKGKTILSSTEFEIKKSKDKQTTKITIANQIGELIAKKAVEKKIKKVVFDRGGYKYHGRVKALADGAKKGGLQF
ncbi:MAG: 50S ribosomal protein L18 [Minisyncoccales bacterium]